MSQMELAVWLKIRSDSNRKPSTPCSTALLFTKPRAKGFALVRARFSFGRGHAVKSQGKQDIDACWT